MDIASSIATNGMVFKHFFESFDLMMVHDNTLEVERGINYARVFRSYYSPLKTTKYPIMLFNRSPVKRSQEFFQAGVHHRIMANKRNFNFEELYGIWGNIDYSFLMIFKDQRQAEQFEIMYTADRHISRLKKFTATYDLGGQTEYGPLDYELLWSDLGSYGYGEKEMGYITIGGEFKCKGEHLVFLDRLAKGIKWVHIRGYEMKKVELFHIVLDLTRENVTAG
jgi:hypothetical protein